MGCINFLLLFTFTPPFVHSHLTGRTFKKVNLILHKEPDGGGPKIEYFDYPAAFEDAQGVIYNAEWEEVKLVCVERGVFIFYSDIEYFAFGPDTVQLFSGVNKCTSPATLLLGSFRHSGSTMLDPEETPYLSIFSELYYSGSVYSITDKSTKYGMSQVQPALSLITVGAANWSVTTHSGKTFCLQTFLDSKKDVNVCLVPILEEFFGEEDEDGPLLKWKHVKRGCDSGEEKLINTCFDYFAGEVQKPAVAPIMPTTMQPTEFPETTSAPVTSVKPETNNTVNVTTPKPPGNETSSTSKPITDCSDADDLAFLLRMRVTNDFFSNYQFLLPRDKKNSWRTELIDLSFDISISLTNQVLEPDFLPQVREFLIYFLEKVIWSNGTLHAKPSLEFKTLTYQTKECLTQVTSNNLALVLKRKLALDISFPLEPNKIASDFERKPNLDLIMELAYLIFNMVSCTCHQVLAFQSNFWLDYIATIDTSYFIPMAEHWKKKSLISHHYSILLGGYDIKLQYELLAATATSLFRAMKYLEVYPRPQGLL